jgi:imidazoleglycerol-phosphate dehydratase
MVGAADAGWQAVRLRRKSRETVVSVELAVPSGTEVTVELPDPLIQHGVESFGTWAGISLRLVGRGDHAHHVVEDAALALGRAIQKSLGTAGRRRVGGATVPMDDALVQVALDLSDRPYSALDPSLPPLVRHFLRSLAHEARWTLHVRTLAGDDEHHITEASFKALGIALDQAARRRSAPRSRKGSVEWEEGEGW